MISVPLLRVARHPPSVARHPPSLNLIPTRVTRETSHLNRACFWGGCYHVKGEPWKESLSKLERLAQAMRLKVIPLEVCVLVMIIGVLGALLFPAGDHDLTHRFPPTVAGSGNDFWNIAGEYYQGAARGRYLRLSILADGRYSFIWSGCTGVHHRESGYARNTDGSYELSPVKSDGSKIDRRFLLVRWQSRRYLVPPEIMQKFCDAVVNGDEPRNEYTGDFWLRLPPARAEGRPVLPERWAAYLRENLAIGRITEVTDAGLLRVSFGAAGGIQEGAILKVRPDRRHDDRWLRVVSIQDGCCTARECSTYVGDEPLKPGREVIAARVIGEIDRR
jgi:hypothetical protein